MRPASEYHSTIKEEAHFFQTQQHVPSSALLVSEGNDGLFSTSSATCCYSGSSLNLQVPSMLSEKKRYCNQFPLCTNITNREHDTDNATAMSSGKEKIICGASISTTQTSISTIMSRRTSSISTRINTRRATLTKLELCESVIQGVTCKFGSRCAFAHSDSELQFTTLRERAEAGLIDIRTYRTRPCLDHFMTGSW